MVDYYVPPKEKSDVPAIHYSVEKKEDTFSFVKNILKGKPSKDDLKNFALEVGSLFNDGFQWKDIAEIMSISIKYLNSFLFLSVEEKRENVVTILNYIIDNTDTPYLPDSFFDPLFKSMVPHFVELLIPDSIEDYFPSTKIHGAAEDSNILEFAKEITEEFKDGFQWQDLVNTTRRSIQFMNQFIDTTKDEKIEKTKSIIKTIIEKTDTPFLPDYYTDSIFESLSDGFIEHIFNAVPTF